jgi:HTH-type transcriptional regulator/antitoxin HipB
MQVKTSKDLGALVREQRTRLALTQEELAERVGVSRLWIVQLEKGKPTAQIGLVLRTFQELGLALDAAASSTIPSSRKGAARIDLSSLIQGALPEKS